MVAYILINCQLLLSSTTLVGRYILLIMSFNKGSMIIELYLSQLYRIEVIVNKENKKRYNADNEKIYTLNYLGHSTDIAKPS